VTPHRWFGLNPIVAFWFAYIVTRPLGASFADWLAWPPGAGGLGLGHGTVSLVSTLIIIGLVAYMALTGKAVMVRAPGPHPPAGSGGPVRPAPPAGSGRPGRSGPPAGSGLPAQPGAGLGPSPSDGQAPSGRHRRPD